MEDLLFENPLIEGIIVERKGRFIVEVEINGEIHICHCPATGHIGGFELNGRPCLLSCSKDSSKRKTKYTMEAISLDLVSEVKKSWIGINQVANNRYIEHFLRDGSLSKIIGLTGEVKRERQLGKSKIDFQVGDCFIEVKSPIRRLEIPIPDYIKKKSNFKSAGPKGRLIKHIESLHTCLKADQRAIFLIVFVYDSPIVLDWEAKQMERWTKDMLDVKDKKTFNNRMKEIGKVSNFFKKKYYKLERWQVNLNINERGVELVKCVRLGLSF